MGPIRQSLPHKSTGRGPGARHLCLGIQGKALPKQKEIGISHIPAKFLYLQGLSTIVSPYYGLFRRQPPEFRGLFFVCASVARSAAAPSENIRSSSCVRCAGCSRPLQIHTHNRTLHANGCCRKPPLRIWKELPACQSDLQDAFLS